MLTQGTMLLTLLVLAALGLGAIAAVAILGAKRGHDLDESEEDLVRVAASEADRAALEHRRHKFLQRYPAWAGKDFERDPSSPWNTDPEFAGRR